MVRSLGLAQVKKISKLIFPQVVMPYVVPKKNITQKNRAKTGGSRLVHAGSAMTGYKCLTADELATNPSACWDGGTAEAGSTVCEHVKWAGATDNPLCGGIPLWP